MAYIPEDAKWFIADLVVEFTIYDNDMEKVIHINIVLVEASSAEDAYLKALDLGKDYETSYTNSDGNLVDVRFVGLRELNVIHDELEHGAELTYESPKGLTDEEIEKLARSKEALAVFRSDEE